MNDDDPIFQEELQCDILSGVIHDYNNINTLIIGNILLAETLLDSNSDHQIRECLLVAEKAAKHAKEFVQLLISYTGKNKKNEFVSISNIIKQATDFLVDDPTLRLEYNLPEKELKIHCVEFEIMLVVRNIVFNAKQAMVDGGRIRISVFETSLPDSNFLSRGKYVKLIFEDEGEGILPKNINNIFSSHYTTKAAGHGLGLAICLSIIKYHKGNIKVYSELGKGTKFEVFLPVSRDFL